MTTTKDDVEADVVRTRAWLRDATAEEVAAEISLAPQERSRESWLRLATIALSHAGALENEDSQEREL